MASGQGVAAVRAAERKLAVCDRPGRSTTFRSSMKIKKPSKSGELDRKEWYFVEVGGAEMKAAFIYEYARELLRRSPATIDWIIKSESVQRIYIRPQGRINYEKLMRDHLPDFIRICKDRLHQYP